MKLAVAYSQDNVETLGVTKSQNFGFSKDAEEMIFTMFTKNIYSNPIGSVVREITSNCFDSHKEAGVNEPVIVKLTKENAEYYISFIDVGVGMSPERITKVYAQYFNSTKRNDNNQIGGFGIGGKTPLAYAESFFLITTFNGFKYTYSIRKGTKSPVLDLLGREKTKDHNGTTVKIPVRSADVSVFEREINRQLYYFENVIFEGFSSTVKNDYTIVEGKNFLYRGKDYNQYAHICLGRVAYPIDFSVIDDDDDFYQSDWNVPVAIKMEIGEIGVTVSREAIDYTEATKKLIKKRLLEVKAEMLDMLDKQHAKLDSLEDFYRMEDSSSTLFISKNDSIDVRCFSSNRQVVFSKLDALEIPSQAEVIHQFYDVSMYGKKGKREHTWDKSLKSVAGEHVYLVNAGEEMPRKKNAYMKYTFKHFYSLKRKNLTISEVKHLIKRLTPKNSTATNKVIFNQFRELQKDVYKLVEKKAKRYSSIVVPDGFTVSSGRTYNPNHELPITYASSRYGFTKEKVKMSVIVNCKATIFYGDLDSETEMQWASDQYKSLFLPKANNKFSLGYYDDNAFPVRFVMVAKNNLKYITELKNVKPLIEFNKMLIRKRDAVMKTIEREMFFTRLNNQNTLFMNENLFSAIDKDFTKTIKKVLALKATYNGVKSYSVDTQNGSKLLRVLDIDRSKIKYKGGDLFNVIEETTEKNGMLRHVNVRADFNPSSKYNSYSEKEIADILQLFSLAYVK